VTAAVARIAAVLLAVAFSWALAGAGAARPADQPTSARPVPGHRGAELVGVPPAEAAPPVAPAPRSPVATPPSREAAAPARTRVAGLALAALALALGTLGLAVVQRVWRRAA
jgi:hypothetical protein